MTIQKAIFMLLSASQFLACGSLHDRRGNAQALKPLPRPRVVLAYEVNRSSSETLKMMSQRFQVPLTLLEKFNPRQGQGRRKNVIYVPLLGKGLAASAVKKNKPKLVKVMRDPFLRPVSLGEWSPSDDQTYQSLDEWFTPDETLRLSMPVSEGYISSGFYWRWNRFHKGLDIATNAGTPILAAQDGEVLFSGRKKSFGFLVVIQHKEGQTFYAHCQSTNVKVGQKISRGDVIARVGTTGHSFSPHVHFEYHDNQGQALDPTPFLVRPCTRPIALTAQAHPDSASPAWAAKPFLCQSSEI